MQGASLHAGDMRCTLQALPGSSCCAFSSFECTAGRGPGEECVHPMFQLHEGSGMQTESLSCAPLLLAGRQPGEQRCCLYTVVTPAELAMHWRHDQIPSSLCRALTWRRVCASTCGH